MQTVTVSQPSPKPRVSQLLCWLSAGLLLSLARVSATEDPPNCSLANGGAGNTSQGGINFSMRQAHVGDEVPVFPSLGMVPNACRAINVTGTVWIATGLLTNFMKNASLYPGELIRCPSPNTPCQPGPYNVYITSELVGAGVSYPSGFLPGVSNDVRVVEYGVGKVLTGIDSDQMTDFHTASIHIVTPCLQVVTELHYPSNTQNCFPAGATIDFTGYVANCGDIQMTNVTVLNSRPLLGAGLTDPNGLPFAQPLTLPPGQAVHFKGSFAPTSAETCAASATNLITVRGTDTSDIGGPRASVTNATALSATICPTPCLTVAQECSPAISGQLQTVNGALTNCGNVTLTNLIVADDIHGLITTIASLAPCTYTNYSRTVLAPQCGTTTNLVTVTGNTDAGDTITAQGTSSCTVTDPFPPVIRCPGDLKLPADAGRCDRTNVLLRVTATDNCQVTNLVISPPSGSTFPVGVTTVTGTATDASGNQSSCSFTVTVTDTQDPLVLCPGNLVLPADAGQCYRSNVLLLVTATDNCGVTNLIITPPSGSTFPVGVTTVTATAADASGNLSSCSFTVTVTENACLFVSQNCTAAVAGQPQSVTGVVSNCGTVTLTNVVVEVPALGVITNFAALAPGASAAYARSFTAQCGSHTNTVTARGTSPCGTVVTNSATAICQVTGNPAIMVTQGHLPVACSNQVIRFTGVVTNAGNTTLTNVVVTDSQAGVLLTIPSLPAGAATNYAGSYSAASGVNSNQVTAAGTDLCSGVIVSSTASAITTLDCPLSIRVVKQCAYPAGGPECFPPGAPIQFTGYVTNAGSLRLTNVTVMDGRTTQLLDTNGLALLQPLTLDAGQAVGFHGSFAPELAEICDGSAASTITARGTDATGPGGPNASVTNSASSSCAICVTPCLTVTADYAPAIFGQPQTVSGALTNCGNITITNIAVSDNIYGSITINASLAPGGFTNYSQTFTATHCGTTTNTVTATGATVCGIRVAASATAVITVSESPCLFVSQNCAPAGAGEAQTISGVVSNCGNVTLTNVVVSGDSQGTITNIVSLAPGASASYTGSLAADCRGQTNMVTARGTSLCGTAVTNSATAVCPGSSQPAIAVTLMHQPVNCTNRVLVFTGVVTNTGNTTLTNVIVADSQAGVVLTLPALAAGDSATYSGSYSAGACVNENQVTAYGVDHCSGVVVTDTASTNSTVDCPLGIKVVSDCAYPTNRPNCFAGSAAIHLSAYVTNCGSLRLTNVTVTATRTTELFGLDGLPLSQPLALDAGQVVAFRASFTLTLAELCARRTVCTLTVQGTDGTGRSGPGSSVTNSLPTSCAVCATPCLTMTQEFAPPVFGQPHTVSGTLTNCGDLTLTNLIVTDDFYGTIATYSTLAPGESTNYSRTFIATQCGTLTNTVRTAAATVCGEGFAASTTTVVTENPCLSISQTCDPAIAGEARRISGVVSNCGNVTLTNVVVDGNELGVITNFASLAPGTSVTYSRSFTAACGGSTHRTSASGVSACGASASASATNYCAVECVRCIEVFVSSELPPETNCFAARTEIMISGYVTNCGSHELTNVIVWLDRIGALLLFHPTTGAAFTNGVTLPPAGYAVFTNSFVPTPEEACAASATNVFTATAQDATEPGNPLAAVTNSFTEIYPICVVPPIPCPLACPPDVVTNAGPEGVVVHYPAPTIIGNCSNVVVACTPPSGSVFPPGKNIVVCEVLETANCRRTCSFAVIVVPDPRLNLRKFSLLEGTNVAIGETFTYAISFDSLAITNAAVNLHLIDYLPVEEDFVSATTNGARSMVYDPATHTIDWDFGTWPARTAGPTNTVTVRVNTNAFIGATITNTASLVSSNLPPVIVHDRNPLCTNCPPGVTVITNCSLVISPGVVETNTARVRQTGLFYQPVGLTNPCARTVTACRLYLAGLSTNVQVYNASGFTNGVPYLQYNSPIPPGQGIEFTVEYYVPNRRTLPAPNFRVEVVMAETVPPPGGTVASVLRALAYTNGAFLVEFSTRTNRTYYVQYTSDVGTNAVWKTAVPSVPGNGTSVQWLDSGPPKTDSPPRTQTNRFYRVLLVP